MDADDARRDLYELMSASRDSDWKIERALALGAEHLGVDNAHLTEIHADSDYWTAVASTDDPDEQFPAGLTLDFGTTYCRRVLATQDSIALHDAAAQGWADDPAYETHGLRCYHGTPISVGGEPYGTVCFVSEAARGEPFSDEETLFAELLARLIEHELRRERTAARIERLERFAGVLAHDLRNPLAVAHGHLEEARKTHASDHLAVAGDALDRIRTIISDVLTMARQGRTAADVTEVRLSTVVEACWQSVEAADATLVVEDDLRIRAAPGRLRHLFENLFRNAIDHGDAGATVRVGGLADDTGFYVADDGRGIPEAEREVVFERGHTTDEEEGLGLGLAIVDAVVAAHDWRIAVTESGAGGARFEIRDVVVVAAPGG